MRKRANKRQRQRLGEFLEGLRRWMNDDETHDIFADNGILKVHVDEDERFYCGFTHPVLDPDVNGIRFSYCTARQQFCYNCLIRIAGTEIVLKVITSDDGENIYREFRPIFSSVDIVDALAHHVYHLRWLYNDKGDWTCVDLRDGSVRA